jgi:CheY-specific phosphatase CheX
MRTLPPEVHEAFTSAAITTLQELVQVQVFSDDPLRQTESITSGPVVIATIRLVRDPPGSMSLVLTADTAAKLAARYLPMGVVPTAEIIDDVAGEFANVIAGQAKTMLKGTHYHFNLSMPTVLRADDGWCQPATPIPIVTLGFNCEFGEFLLQAGLV